MENKNTKFGQLVMFATEILYLIDEGKSVSVEVICEQIENGTIVNYVKNTFKFKNSNSSSLIIDADVNAIFKNKYVSKREAEKYFVSKNGLIYVIHLVLEDLNEALFNMKFNDINADDYRCD